MKIEPDIVNGVKGPHVIFYGMNLHVESGSGTTAEAGAGAVFGSNNLISGPSASILGGNHNSSTGPAASILEGYGVIVNGTEETYP